jgi:hypothetical protein
MAHVTVDGCPAGQGSEQNVAGRRARAPGSVNGLVVRDTPQVEEAPIAPGKEPRADADPAAEQVPVGSEVADRTHREITLGDRMR